MNFQKIQRAYADMRRVLKTAQSRRGLLTDSELKTLYSALETTGEANDFGAIIYLYEQLISLGALRASGPVSLEGEKIYFRYIRSLLKVCDYDVGKQHLEQAVARFPNNLDLFVLQMHFLWFNEPDELARRVKAGDLPELPSTSLLGLYGEAAILAGSYEQAYEMVIGANAAGQGKTDLLFLQMNSETDGVRKLSSFNSYLGQNNLRKLKLRDESLGIGIDNLEAIDPSFEAAEDEPLVTVITTAYECAEYLEVSAGSILNQSYPNIELMIVDDCSDDATRAKIAELAARDPRVVPVYRSENGGTYIAKSEAFQRANGEYTIFHDSDDWAHPDKIRREVAELRSNPDLICLQSSWVRINEDSHILMQLSGNYAHPNPAATMVRTGPVLARCGTFDPIRTGADTEFKRRIQRAFGPRSTRTERRVFVLGRQHGGSLTQSGSSTMKNFGWSVPRALYRAAWFDRYAAGGRDLKYWSPLGVRQTAIPVTYDFNDLMNFDRMARLGLDRKFEDLLIVIRGQHAKRHLTQIHRLIMALHKENIRVGLWFEDRAWGHETWQGKHLRSMGYLHNYDVLDDPKTKLCMLMDSTDTGINARVLSTDQMEIADQAFTSAKGPEPEVQTSLNRFLISPNWAQHVDMLKEAGAERPLVFARPSAGGFEPLQGTAFAWNTALEPDRVPQNALVLLRGGWSEEDMWEATLCAQHLGRQLYFDDVRAEDMILHDFTTAVPFALSVPMEHGVGADLVNRLMREIAQSFVQNEPLDIRLTLTLPAEGL